MRLIQNLPLLILLLQNISAGLAADAMLTTDSSKISIEYQVKAGDLFYFTQFVDWPKAAFPNDLSPIVIGILGDDPFGAVLDEYFKDERVNHRKLVIKRSKKSEDLKKAHLVFVARSERKSYAEIIKAFKGSSILTVGDAGGFNKSGGIIEFFISGNKVHYEINLGSAKKAGLKISSKLLRLAKIVEDPQGDGG